MKEAVAVAAGVDVSYVALTVMASSVNLFFTISTPPSASPDMLESSLSSSLGSAADASSALGITVVRTAVQLTTPSGASDAVVEAQASSIANDIIDDAASLGTAVLVTVIVAPTVFVLCLLALLTYCCMRHRRLQSTRPTPAPMVAVGKAVPANVLR